MDLYLAHLKEECIRKKEVIIPSNTLLTYIRMIEAMEARKPESIFGWVDRATINKNNPAFFLESGNGVIFSADAYIPVVKFMSPR